MKTSSFHQEPMGLAVPLKPLFMT